MNPGQDGYDINRLRNNEDDVEVSFQFPQDYREWDYHHMVYDMLKDNS